MDTIIDCYTDEPAGLGVPPYLGTYPRYIFGMLGGCNYLTIDDLRLLYKYKQKKDSMKTNIAIYNTTRVSAETEKILGLTKNLYVILGVHVPGKYLSAVPGTLREVSSYISHLRCRKILTGPAATDFGTQLEGGRKQESSDLSMYDDVSPELVSDYGEIAKAAIRGAGIMDQIPQLRIAEIETGRGCTRNPGCSFCTEPLKHDLEFREQEDIISEMRSLKEMGVEHFRLGKQSCFYSYKLGEPEEIEKLLKGAADLNPKTLHIDNANPAMVNEENTSLIVKYCTPGNVAAFGVESFDPEVQRKNNLNCTNEMVMDAARIINRIGGARSENGMHHLLPGINLLFGLTGESKRTHECNYEALKSMLDAGLLLRRINIRQVTTLPGTRLQAESGNKFLRKNKKYYWKWRDSIRQDIDYEMLKKLVPIGTVLTDVRSEVYDGNTTFCRQIGSYPLIVGVRERLELGKFYRIEVTSHMLRSIVGKVVVE